MSAELRQRADDAGKPEPLITVTGLPPKPEFIELLESCGVERLMLGLPPVEGPLEALQAHAEAVQRFQT